ncbi:poly(A) polymerase [Plantactinospora sp. ZYX-F-223]|uniref:poly(A) polymerase n=1 Tax=Plantactinospora sp. ZYX-F-223 TaxID=3144103 RepID=UPI0031FCC7EB
MRTSEEIYHRIRWDPRFDPARFVLGVNVRGTDPKRIPLPAFTPGGDIPWHRVLFIEADGEVVWDRATGLDRIDSTPAGRSRRPRLLRAPSFTAGTPFRWSAGPDGRSGMPAAGWRAAPAPAGGVPLPGPARLRVLTWNTLWDRYDSDRIDTARRRPLLLAALEHADADVIALQEVEAELLHLLLNAPWVRAGYTLDTDPTGRDVDDTGLLLLSRLPVREAGRHPLGPHKAVAAITVESAAGPLVVAGTHLTSDHADGGAARRQVELARLAEALAGIDGPVVLVGDFNDDGCGPGVLPEVRDAWSELHGPADRTPTFDPLVNPLAAVSSLSGRAGRLDRVLLRGTGLRAGAAALLGTAPASVDGLFVSDHYGVTVDVVVHGSTDLAGVPGDPAAPVGIEPEPESVHPPPVPGHRGAAPASPGVPAQSAADPLTRRVVSALRDVLPEAVPHVVGSRRLGCALPGADLDLVLALPGAVELSAVEARVRAALPAATGLRQVRGARVPGLRLRVDDRDVDLVVVATGDVPATAAVPRRAALDTAAAVALSAVSDAEELLAAVRGHRSAFVGLARQVKAWARVRGLDSAPFGGLPGLAWTVLAARTVRQADDLSPVPLLRRFFADWAAWDWREPVALHPSPAGPAGPDGWPAPVDSGADEPPVRILTPSAPVRSCSGQVSAAGRDLLTRELYAGWELLDAAGAAPEPPPELSSPPPLHRRHAAWAVLTVRAVRGEAFSVTLGRVRGRVRALLAAVERAGAAEPHAWPRPFERTPERIRYAIGLGPTPPAPVRLAEEVAPWTAGLPGATVDWLPGGDVPTLR